MNKRDEERMYWVILCDAEIQSQICATSDDFNKDAVIWQNVALQARLTLRDKFSINLDDIYYSASQEMSDMFNREKIKLSFTPLELARYYGDKND